MLRSRAPVPGKGARQRADHDSSRAVYLADQRLDGAFELFSVSLAGGPATRLNPRLAAGW